MNGYIVLDYTDVALASILLLINGALSVRFSLGLEKRLLISGLRMVVQLTLVGLLLKGLFTALSPWLTGLVVLVMVGFAGREIWARQEHRLRGIWGLGLGTGAIALTGVGVTMLALGVLIRPDPWWTPQFSLPLLGMIMGNAMTGISLTLDTLHRAVLREQRAIEAQLLLGADRWQAVRPFLRHALRAGFMPIINAMAITGIVSLPGMMTGQILSGVDPSEAVKYQLVIMFLIAGATGIAVILASLGAVYRLTDDRHRLRLDRLQ